MEKQLILLASPTLRRGPLSALQRFVRDYERFLAKYEIITTEGCRRAILRSGLLHSHPNLKAPLPGYLGGIVELSSMVVKSQASIEAVIYLIDPRDPSSIFPETNAIKRECVVHKVTFLSTSRAAREWAAMNWAQATPEFEPSVDVGKLSLVRPVGAETIALVAHDGMKDELLRFARDHFRFLLKFRERVATGTTGTLLNGKRPEGDRIKDEEWHKLEPICNELRQQIENANIKDDFITCMESGPKGGDVMIAMKVLDRDCQRIVFFENPMKPHEHTEDIQLLERTGRLRGKYTICVHDHKTAARFVEHWEDVEQSDKPPRLLLSFVLERLFGVKCVLVESSDQEGTTWRNLSEAAGFFLLSHVATLANERRKASERVRVSVSWGVGSSTVVDEMARALEQLRDLDERLQSNRITRDDMEDLAGYADYPFQTYSLADDRFFRPGNVDVAPIQGLVGSVNETVEANEIAHRMKELFGGNHVALAANALVMGGDVERRKKRFADVYAHWDNTDIVLATAGPVGEQLFKERPETPHFRGFTDEMSRAGACGDVGGLFLDRFGNPVSPKRFAPTSMSAEQLRKVRTRGSVVVIAGAQPARVEITLAALMGGWISVLITDVSFAKSVVQSLAARVEKKDVTVAAPETDGPLLDCVRRAVGLDGRSPVRH